MAELSVSEKSPSSSSGTSLLGLMVEYGSRRCSPLARSTSCSSQGILFSARKRRTGRLAFETGCMYSFMALPPFRCWVGDSVVGDGLLGGLPDGGHGGALLLLVDVPDQPGAAGDQREAAHDLGRHAHVAQAGGHGA